MAEGDRDRLLGSHGLCAWGHEVNGIGAALAVCRVGRAAVQGLTVVQGDATGWQVRDNRLAVIHRFAHIQQDITALGPVVAPGMQMGAWDELHGPIV